jgi:hypothetical protein
MTSVFANPQLKAATRRLFPHIPAVFPKECNRPRSLARGKIIPGIQRECQHE